MSEAKPKPLPRRTKASKEFWDGCKQHEIRIQKCSDCGTYRFPPQVMCRACQSTSAEWGRVSGRGTIYSYIIPTHQSPGELPARGFTYPYAVALIELDGTGGVRIPSNIIDCDLDQVSIGMAVEPVFVTASEDIELPLYKPRIA
ncbi:Zn-ribbon domain-containing OB-fold protein [Hyphomonas sp. FCG-A18]|uniref:Zn-ribbon domain-containing OB-fold protein n=1 Tax=Hyphomonas sp. FCG-A18 TaxID=3080019 RepID=UPI002B2BED12|nr:Zn-ribbon domain-containing OB-fold protein [Hyphomonas sp. FCG-A18]